jgi:hypothetical protein
MGHLDLSIRKEFTSSVFNSAMEQRKDLADELGVKGPANAR